MTIETVTFISSLNALYPAASDLKSEGDDHIRNIKTAVKGSFPNVSGVVSATNAELSFVTGVTSAIQTQMNAKAPLNGVGTSGTWPISITGSVTGSSTSAATLTTPRAINGVLFDGSAAITVFDATKAPLTGAGTSGTWPISITGSAASDATKAPIASPVFTGNVGIGAASPSGALEISRGAATNAELVLRGNGTTYAAGFSVNSNTTGEAVLFNRSNTPLIVGTNNLERMRIDADGTFMVGTPTVISQNGFTMLSPSGATAINVHHPVATTSGAVYVGFIHNAATIGNITQSGTTAVLYNTTSDARLKTNVTAAPDAGALIDDLQVRSFDWLSDSSHQRYGFVAQELIAVAPEAVSKPADPEEMMAVDYSKLVPMLVREIQSLRARLLVLESN